MPDGTPTSSLYHESRGGSVAGRLTVVDRNPATGQSIEIDCANFGSGAYSIPRSVEHLNFLTDARFILAIETGGMFQRLNNHRFWRRASASLSRWVAFQRVQRGALSVCFQKSIAHALSRSLKASRTTVSRLVPEKASNLWRSARN
jgi:hypothetical protein